MTLFEFFSGTATLSRMFASLGCVDLSMWDILYGKCCDSANLDIVPKVRDAIANFSDVILWLGICCKTWSPARKDDGGPPPLRTEEYVWGLPDLDVSDARRVNEANDSPTSCN